MPKGIGAWIILGIIAASLERWILPGRGRGDFLGSLALAWVGAVLGSLLAYAVGLGEFMGAKLANLGFDVLGIVVILAGVRLVRRGRPSHAD